jgi:hypothetical protein
MTENRWYLYADNSDKPVTGTLDECCVALVEHEMTGKQAGYRLQPWSRSERFPREHYPGHCHLIKEVASDGVRCRITEIGAGDEQDAAMIEQAVIESLARAGAVTVVEIRGD